MSSTCSWLMNRRALAACLSKNLLTRPLDFALALAKAISSSTCQLNYISLFLFCIIQCDVAALARANTNGIVDGNDEDAAIANLARLCCR